MIKSSSSLLLSVALPLLLLGVARAATPEANVVSGVVVTADGKPVAGATVILFAGGRHTAVSDGAGQFRFEHVPPSGIHRGVFAFRDNLVAPKTEIGPVVDADSPTQYYKPLRLTMHEGKRAKFILTDKRTGKPVGGARVRFAYPDSRKLLSDKDGIALTAGLSTEPYRVNIFGDGYARTSTGLSFSDENVATCKVELQPGGIVRGMIVDESGKPIPEVEVEYTSTTTGDSWTGDKPTTDKDGKYQERFAPLGVPLSIAFSKQGFAIEQRGDDGKLVLTVAKPLVELKIVMKRPARQAIAGTITDRAGRPVAGARLDAAPFNGREGSATTDAKGRFCLDLTRSDDDNSEVEMLSAQAGNHPAPCLVQVVAKGFAPQTLRLKTGTAEHPSETSIKLDSGHTVHGRVVDDKGKPVPHATFVLQGSNAYPGHDDGISFQSDDQGTFGFDSLPANARLSLLTPIGQYLQDAKLKLDTPQPIILTIDSPGAIRGRVLDAETGKPIAKFHVRLDVCRMSERNDTNGYSTAGKWWRPGMTIENADGRFEIDPLPNRMPVEMIVTAEGYDRSVVPRAVARHADQQTEVKINLLPLKPSDYSTIRGQVVNYDGKPLSGVQLQMIVASTDHLAKQRAYEWRTIAQGRFERATWIEQSDTATTDADGRFEFKHILPGRGVVVLYRGGDVPSNAWIAGEPTRAGRALSATIRVPQPATVHGTLDRKTLADGTAVDLYTSAPFNRNFQQSIAPSSSTFEIKNVPAGTYTLYVYGKPKKMIYNGRTYYGSEPLYNEQITVSAGETKELFVTK